MAPSFGGVRSIASMGFLTRNSSSNRDSPTNPSPNPVETGRFTLPVTCSQVREHLHSCIPDTLPSTSADVHEVRYFLYHLLTLKADEVGRKWPQWVLETCAAWDGTGADLRDIDESKLRLLCPASWGKCLIYGREELELTCPPQCRVEIGKVIERTVSRLKNKEEMKGTLHLQWQQTRNGHNTASRLVEARNCYNKRTKSKASRWDVRGLVTGRSAESAISLQTDHAQSHPPSETHLEITKILQVPRAKSTVSGMTMYRMQPASEENQQLWKDEQREHDCRASSAASTVSAVSFHSTRPACTPGTVHAEGQSAQRDNFQSSRLAVSSLGFISSPKEQGHGSLQSARIPQNGVLDSVAPSPSRPLLSSIQHSLSRVSNSTRSSSSSDPTASARSSSTAPTSPSASIQEMVPFPRVESRGSNPFTASYQNRHVSKQPSQDTIDPPLTLSPCHIEIASDIESRFMSCSPAYFYHPGAILSYQPDRPIQPTHSTCSHLAVNDSAFGKCSFISSTPPQNNFSHLGLYDLDVSTASGGNTPQGRQRCFSAVSQHSAPIPSRYLRRSQPRTPTVYPSIDLPEWFSSLEPVQHTSKVNTNSMNYPRPDICAPREHPTGRTSPFSSSSSSSSSSMALSVDQNSGRITPRGHPTQTSVEGCLVSASRLRCTTHADQHARQQAQSMILKNKPSFAQDKLLYRMSREHGLDNSPDRMGPCVRYTKPGYPRDLLPTLVETIREREILAGKGQRGQRGTIHSNQIDYNR
ncbi:hypothetical protein K491DRAFT_681260 [Lophiostoma macrostomum CBS 122681]|uniref:Uncharacterized protein n=1 Tax=Lophiostoma macrostomum CBS 122681 TaxID=1314788 RepID=A0A6A6T129_9PLEO|nr:hypothetical protein K491DRAFT_681260 [Lophiostoma macrostomum CBS 122681]